MNITIGNVVRGSDFFDREELLLALREVLKTDSVLLAAPRRVGKTSLMHRLMDVPQPDTAILFLDAQNYRGPEDLVTDIILQAGELRKDPRKFVSDLFAGLFQRLEEVELWKLRLKLRETVRNDWKIQGERAIRELLKGDGLLLLILDELPILLHRLVEGDPSTGPAEALDLLDWLRHLRQQPDLNPRVKQLLGGSIGLPRIASLLAASHKINDLRQIEVGPLSRDQARKLACQLLRGRGVTLEPDVLEAFLDEIGTFIPIFIQIMAAAVATEVITRHVPPSMALVRQCYEQRALGPEYRICFEDYYERLSRYYAPDEARAARRILHDLAVAGQPLRASSLRAAALDELGPNADRVHLDRLLSWLRDDFYLEPDASRGTVEFKNKWLRDWWRRYHATGL